MTPLDGLRQRFLRGNWRTVSGERMNLSLAVKRIER